MITEWFQELGPIVCFSIPGSADRVFVKEPETIKTVLSLDGKNPIEPGFDHIVHYRQKLRRDIFHQTAGLIGSHGEPWYEVRSKVNRYGLSGSGFWTLCLNIILRFNKIC